MSWSWILYIGSGVVATIITAHLMCKPRQSPPAEHSEQKPVSSTNNIEINVYPSLYPSLSPFPFVIPEADPELARQLDEIERRIEENKSRSASPVIIDQRRLEYVRFLVQSGRLTDDL